MKKRVLALGFFDGVHRGHRALLEQTVKTAREEGLISSAMTYSAHPAECLGNRTVKLINTTEERVFLMKELCGIGEVIVRGFTREFSELSCSEFIDRIVIGECNAEHVVAGFNFRFGKNGVGDAEMLNVLCRERGLGCTVVPEVDYMGERVSSSLIRGFLRSGDIARANDFLGHNHCIISKIVHGDNIGGKLIVPTINQYFGENIEIPKYGVYASVTYIGEKRLMSITNIGVRPTVSSSGEVRAETNIIDFSENVYGKTARVELVGYLRGEKKFPSAAELRAQIEKDIECVRKQNV